jgi:hypothetical protein
LSEVFAGKHAAWGGFAFATFFATLAGAARCGAGFVSGEGLAGANGLVGALIAMPIGTTVAGGYFTQTGGSTISRVAAWDGTSWAPLGRGFDANPRELWS